MAESLWPARCRYIVFFSVNCSKYLVQFWASLTDCVTPHCGYVVQSFRETKKRIHVYGCDEIYLKLFSLDKSTVACSEYLSVTILYNHWVCCSWMIDCAVDWDENIVCLLEIRIIEVFFNGIRAGAPEMFVSILRNSLVVSNSRAMHTARSRRLRQFCANSMFFVDSVKFGYIRLFNKKKQCFQQATTPKVIDSFTASLLWP